MEEGKKHIDDLFREGLKGYREMPDAVVWTSIEQRLPEAGRHRSFLWLWILLMLALLSSMGYYAYKYRNSSFLPPAGTETGRPSSAGENRNYEENVLPGAADLKNEPGESDGPGQTGTDGAEGKSLSPGTATTGGTPLIKKDAKKIGGSIGRISSAVSPNVLVTDAAGDKNSGSATRDKTQEVPVLQQDQKKNRKTSAAKANSATAPDAPLLDAARDKNSGSAAGDKTQEVSALQQDQKKNGDISAAKANSAASPDTQAPDRDQTKRTKTIVAPVQKEPGPTPVTVSRERTEEVPVTAHEAQSIAKPVSIDPEPAQGITITAEKERAAGVPVQESPLSDARKPPMHIEPSDTQKKLLLAEPVKEYDIRIDQESGENKAGAVHEKLQNAGGGGGGGGAVSSKWTKDNRFSLDGGLKLGYDRGFSEITTSNFTGNLFLQWNVSPRLSIVLQPGVRYQSVNKTSVFPQSAFHDVTSQSLDSAHIYTDSFGIPDFFVQRNFIYRNSYDSITVAYSMASKNNLEVELPLLLQYKLADNISISGGMQLSFGKIIRIQSTIEHYQGSIADTLRFPTVQNDTGVSYPDIPSLSGYFGYNTPEFNTLNQNNYKNPVTDQARFAIMLGFSYEFKRRLFLDLLVRKNISDLGFIPNEQVRKIYSQPYFRVTLGYKLFQAK